MPLYTPEDAEFESLEDHFRWFPAVAAIEYGEQDAPAEIPPALNWLELSPPALRYDFDEVECGLAYRADNGYVVTVWDCSGENDDPWAVFLADDFGVRLLPEYSLLFDDVDDTEREAVLRRSAEDLPDRLLAGEFDRAGAPVAIPEWLME